MYIYFIMIPIDKKNRKWEKIEGSTPLLFNLPLTFSPVSILLVISISIGSEEVQWNLELLIHINTHSWMKINL